MKTQPFKFTVCLSHDVDRTVKTWQYLHLPASFLRGDFRRTRLECGSLSSKLRGDDHYWNFERIMELEDSLNVRSTWFILNETGKGPWYDPRSIVLYKGRYRVRDPAIVRVIRELDANGWEIALHGSYASYQKLNFLRDQKAVLEDILGHEVRGARQHYLNLDIPETWEFHESLGIQYDSSLGFNDRFGNRWNAVHPFCPKHPLTGKTLNVLQIPMTIMDAPWCENEEQLWERIESTIRPVAAMGGTVTINFHQRVFAPTFHFDYTNLYAQIIEWCQCHGARIATLGEVNECWRTEKGIAESKVA